jgi:hypothetical protein
LIDAFNVLADVKADFFERHPLPVGVLTRIAVDALGY